MDYESLLSKASEITKIVTKREIPCFKTEFKPLKKPERSRVSSVNVKKFLAKKEEEERQRLSEEKRKKEELLMLRSQDKKAQKRVQVMLKRTKSANKSVMSDAIDNVNTVDTLNGPKQCDEDDYGYVSQEASAFYEKLMAKYEKAPVEKDIFSATKKKEVKDLNAAKDRVRAALDREAFEEMFPTRKRKKKSKEQPEENSQIQQNSNLKEIEGSNLDINDNKFSHKKKVSFKPAPIVNFNDLLKLAEKKQFEPVVIEKVEKKEEERPLTKKEKLEQQRRQDVLLSRDQRKPQITDKKNAQKTKSTDLNKSEAKLPNQSKDGNNLKTIPLNVKLKKPLPVDSQVKSNVSSKIKNEELSLIDKEIELLRKKKELLIQSKINNKEPAKLSIQKPAVSRPVIDKKPKFPTELKSKDNESKQPVFNGERKPNNDPVKTSKPIVLKSKETSQDSLKRFKHPSEITLKKKQINPRRIDSDEDYDSELDDFIDDGPLEELDYSSHIREIFGYDKRKYRHIDDEDTGCMESSFSQQMKEELVSKKLGLLEDLEDMKKEKEEKMRKLQKLKKR